MKYGYSFDTEEEQKFILSVITAAVLDGDDMIRANKDVNRLIREGLSSDDSTVDERIKEAASDARTSDAALLNTRFHRYSKWLCHLI
jgi:hypothetical protein